VTAVSSAAKGLTQVKRKNFDAAILDLMMPPASFGVEAAAGGRRTGLVLAERIRAIRPEIPIAILTVADDADAKLWCRAHPPAVYLTKGNLALESVSSVQDLIRGSNQVATDDVERWIRRLPILLLHLGIRSRGRPSLAVRDEYDVQDAVRLLLALKYEDVRSEDSGPRVAGRGGRIDFLLPSSHIAVEVKVGLRPGAWKRIGDELLVDVARYRRHPDVSSLICVVVHDGSLDNPEGFASDIRATAASTLDVRVVVLNPFPVPGLRRPTNADRPVLKHRQSPVIGKRTGR
jgi:CheY-like chemotaxis protein